MLETANSNGGPASRRGEAETSASSGSVAGENRSGEGNSSRSGSQEKVNKKLKKDKEGSGTSGTFYLGRKYFPLLTTES